MQDDDSEIIHLLCGREVSLLNRFPVLLDWNLLDKKIYYCSYVPSKSTEIKPVRLEANHSVILFTTNGEFSLDDDETYFSVRTMFLQSPAANLYIGAIAILLLTISCEKIFPTGAEKIGSCIWIWASDAEQQTSICIHEILLSLNIFVKLLHEQFGPLGKSCTWHQRTRVQIQPSAVLLNIYMLLTV